MSTAKSSMLRTTSRETEGMGKEGPGDVNDISGEDELREELPSVFSSLVLGLLHDDTPILDESIPSMETTMAMVDNDALPTWFHQDDDDHDPTSADSDDRVPLLRRASSAAAWEMRSWSSKWERPVRSAPQWVLAPCTVTTVANSSSSFADSGGGGGAGGGVKSVVAIVPLSCLSKKSGGQVGQVGPPMLFRNPLRCRATLISVELPRKALSMFTKDISCCHRTMPPA